LKHYMREYRHHARRHDLDDQHGWGACGWDAKAHDKWHRGLAREWDRHRRRAEREARRWARRHGYPAPEQAPEAPPTPEKASEEDIVRRARQRAAAEVGFYAHLQSYLGVIAFLALINFFTTWYPWFIWPALGWGVGIFAHYMAVFGSRRLKERYFDPA